MDGQKVFVQVTDHQSQCDLCHRPSNQMYRVQIGDNNYKFHSPQCVERATNNYKEKIAKGIIENPNQDDE